MKIHKLLAAMLAACAALSAHAATPEEIAAMDAPALRKLDTVELCTAWHATKAPSVRAELQQHRDYTRRVWWLLERDFPEAGFTYANVVCMWGPPISETSEQSPLGTKRVLVYKLDGLVMRVYLLGNTVQKYAETAD